MSDTIKVGTQRFNTTESKGFIQLYSTEKKFPISPLKRGLAKVRASIEKELSRIPPTSFYDARLKRELALDLELKERRVALKVKEIVRPALPETFKNPITAGLCKHDNYVLITKFAIDFCRRDLQTLQSPNWLNDEVINFYLQLISERAERTRGLLPSVHAFSTFFYPKLRDRGYEAVRTSTRRILPPVFSRSLIMFPIHLGMHWCMAIVDFDSKTIGYYDSLHGNNNLCLNIIRNWLNAESKDKTGFEFDFSGWREQSPKDIPAQENGYDCGVFSLVFAEYLSRRAPFTFSQKDMTYWRERISYEIITGKLLEG